MSTLFNLPTPPLKSFRPSRSSNTTSESLTNLSRTRNSLHDTLVHVTGENDPHKTVESYRLESINTELGRDNVDPTAAQNGIRILHGPAIDVPMISGRLPSYSMQEGRTAKSEPRWDRPLYFVVRRNDAQYPSISFFPHDGLGAGVAMGLAFYQEGMLMKQSSIESCLPPILRHIEFLPFTLRWPGYTHILVKQNLFLIDPDTGHHVTYGRIAQQVSQIFSEFIQRFGDDFDGSATGIQLGPKAVTFHNLRLHQVYVRDSRTMEAEVSYTRRN